MSESVIPHCPLCPDEPALRALDPHLGFRVPLRRCDRCYGIWADSEVVRIAREHYHESHYVMLQGHGRQPCRHCGKFLPEPSEACRECLGDQTLRCPSCARRMTLLSVSGISLDACRSCRSVWFDRGELGWIARHSGEALHRRVAALGLAAAPLAADSRFSGFDPGLTGVDAVDLLQYTPDAVGLVGEGARLTGKLAIEGAEAAAGQAGAATELLSAAGEGALEAGEAGAELAAGAAEVLLELLAGIFSGV